MVMPDLTAERVRVSLMEMAGCDPLRCGLVTLRPRSGDGMTTIEHHRRQQATGPTETTIAARAVSAYDTDDDLAAWIAKQHDE